MEQIRGTMPCQCQAPQYNAVKIDIHQPKVQAPKAQCHKGECCEHNHNLWQNKKSLLKSHKLNNKNLLLLKKRK